MSIKSPTVRHRRLGRELRQLREAAGLTAEAAATHLGWSRPKVNRIENARITVSVPDVTAACDLYGTDAATRAGLIQLCRDANHRGWWTAYSDVFTGSYVALEADATLVQTWEPLVIPGVLQMPDYARAIIAGARPELDEAELDRHVDARMRRKSRVPSSELTLHALLDEDALRRPVGSPELMARQLEEIQRMRDRPNVTIQVLPRSAGAHAGLGGSFSVLSFDEPDPPVGYVEAQAGDIYIEASNQVERLKLRFGRLADMCSPPDESADLIAAARSDHERIA